jgi:hypothetical protein
VDESEKDKTWLAALLSAGLFAVVVVIKFILG